MAYWLFKSEPETWSWDMQKKKAAKGEPWSGVRNHQAKLNMMAMKKGEQCFFYHSGKERRILGIVEVIDHWWGGPISTFAHPIFFYELGDHALVVEQGSEVIGFLLGFLVPHGPHVAGSPAARSRIGYVHLVGIHPDYRRRGVGRLLYDRFTEECRALRCVGMKAITTPGHEGSIRFHVAVGWNVQEVDDYAGPGRRRIVFTKPLVL